MTRINCSVPSLLLILVALFLFSACTNDRAPQEEVQKPLAAKAPTPEPSSEIRISSNLEPKKGNLAALLDEKEAKNEVEDPNWVVFPTNNPLIFTIEFPELRELKAINIGAYVEQKSNFFQPVLIDYYVAQENGNFMKVGNQERQTIPFSGKERRILKLQLNGFAKKVRVKLSPLETLPDWVQASPSGIQFAFDEITFQ